MFPYWKYAVGHDHKLGYNLIFLYYAMFVVSVGARLQFLSKLMNLYEMIRAWRIGDDS